MVISTVSIQKIADIWTALAFGFKNAMLSVPPPNSGESGLFEMEIAVVSSGRRCDRAESCWDR